LEHDITVIGEADEGETGVALALREQPDIVVMDLMMPRINGFEATKLIKRSRARAAASRAPVSSRAASPSCPFPGDKYAVPIVLLHHWRTWVYRPTAPYHVAPGFDVRGVRALWHLAWQQQPDPRTP